MHATIQKPIEEIIKFIKPGEKVFVVGCNNCAWKCHSGGEEEWTQSLAFWAEKALVHDDLKPLVATALPAFEKTLIRIALDKAQGHRQEAARLLGWGRNTLTRKIKALHLD